MTMLDGNSAAELAHDLASMGAPDPAPYLARALDDVVDRVMRGETVPNRGYDCIDLRAFLDEHVPMKAQIEDYLALLLAPSNDEIVMRAHEQRRALEEKVRRHLDGSEIVAERAHELARDAADADRDEDLSEAFDAALGAE